MPLKVTALVLLHPAAMMTGLPPGAAAFQLNVPYIKQEQTNWCWAACCEMVFKFNNLTNVRQCDMATSQFGGNCCAVPSSLACNQGNWPENVYPRYAFSCSRTNSSLTRAAIVAEIDSGRPVEVYYAWSGGGAHVALVTGYFENGDLQVFDPWYGQGRRTYAAVHSAYNLGAWTITYSDLKQLQV